jgi:hypothetical protein
MRHSAPRSEVLRVRSCAHARCYTVTHRSEASKKCARHTERPFDKERATYVCGQGRRPAGGCPLVVQPTEPDWISHRPRERYGPWHAKGHSPVPHFSSCLEPRRGEDPERPVRSFGSQLVHLYAAPKRAVMLPIGRSNAQGAARIFVDISGVLLDAQRPTGTEADAPLDPRNPLPCPSAPQPSSYSLGTEAPRTPGPWALEDSGAALGLAPPPERVGRAGHCGACGCPALLPLLSLRPHRMSCTRMV